MITVVGLALALTLISAPARAAADESTTPEAKPAAEATPAEQFEAIWTRDKFTGDWEGWRTDLQDHGIDLQGRLSQYVQSVASGGIDKNTEYGGTMDYRVNADLRKLFGLWDGFSINMHARTRFGEDVNADAGDFALQNAGLMMPVPGDYNDTDITGLVVSQFLPFYGGRLANVTVGKLDVIDTLTGFFPQIGYGQEGFWNVNNLASNLPWFGAVQGLSLYGGVATTINQEFKMAESGFLFTGTENVSTSWNHSISSSFDEGVWLAGFHRFLWKLDDKPGYFMVFAAGSTREQPSNEPRDHIHIPGQGIVSTKEKNPWDVALYLHQEFWQAEGSPDRKATFMIGGTVGPDNPQFAQYNLYFNVEAFGPMASRPHDRMGFAFYYNWLSDDFVDLVSPVIDLRDQYGFELYYNYEINKWLHLSADLQFVQNERDGQPAIPTVQTKKNSDDIAVIPGVRLVMDF